MPPPQRKRLGEVLLEAGIIDVTQLQAALGHQRRWGGRIGQALIDLKMATEEQIVATLATKLGFRRMQLESLEFGPSLELALRLVPHDFAERNLLLAYAADPANLWVAMADPTNVGVVDELAFRTGRNVKLSLAGDGEVARAIQRLYLGDRRPVQPIALDGIDDAPGEMVGNLHQEFSPVAERYGSRKEPAPGAPPAPPVLTPVAPPAGPRPLAGPEQRLAEAVRGLRTAEPRSPGTAVPPAAIGRRLESILADVEGAAAHGNTPPEVASLSRFTAAVVRILVRRGLLSEQDVAAAWAEAERPTRR